MSYSVEITHEDKNMPDVNEPVSSFCAVEGGNICMATEKVGYERLSRITDRDEAIRAISSVIKEIDKGNSGIWSDAYCVEIDNRWSKGRESLDDWSKLSSIQNSPNLPEYMKSYEAYTGYSTRSRIRKDAVRFLLYYKSGYDIKFEW